MSRNTVHEPRRDRTAETPISTNPDQNSCPILTSEGAALITYRQVEELAAWSSAQLRSRWLELTKKSPPRISDDIMRFAVAYEVQARALGQLSREAARKLEAASIGKAASPAISPGTRLAREWNGTVHIVSIGDDGRITWNDRYWRSLSEVARAITGTRWSGPAFFGLKAKRAS